MRNAWNALWTIMTHIRGSSLMGSSTNSGFYIQHSHYAQKFGTLTHEENNELYYDLEKVTLCGLLLIAVLLTGLLYFFFPVSNWWKVVLGIYWLTWLSSFWLPLKTAHCYFARFPKSRMYHSAEHKTIYLIMADFEPTPENYKKCPKTTLLCGSSQIMLVLIISFGLGVFLCAAALDLSNIIYATIGLAAMIGSILMLLVAVALSVKFKLPIIMFFSVPAMPIILLCLLYEQLFIKEPSEEIIEEAIGVANDFYASYGRMSPQ